MTSSLKNI